jgi:hypothetical protein
VVGRRIVQRPPDWNKLLAYPKAQLTEEEQAFIDGPTKELCAMVSDWQIGQTMDLPPEAWAFIKENGFFALIIPKWRQGILGPCPLPSGDETGLPQRRPRFHRDGPQLPRPGRTVAALRHRRTTQSLLATPGAAKTSPALP